MRTLSYLGFCVGLALAAGCAYTDYDLMYDEYTGEIINTHGKARFQNLKSQLVVIWPDGADNLFPMVDQKANGDRILTNYNFFTTDVTYFWDSRYCSPDWEGCSIFTAPDPEIGDVDLFDGTPNPNCRGFRSLESLISTFRYYGECGRAPLTLEDRLTLGVSGTQLGPYTLEYDLNSRNSALRLDNNAGIETSMPLLGNLSVQLDIQGPRTALARADNPLLANTLNAVADWQDSSGTGRTTLTFLYNGVERSWDVKLLSDGIRRNADRL